MLIASLGKLSVAQDLTAGATDSQNVIQMPAVDYANITDAWWVIDTETIAAGDAADTFKFELVLSQESTLDTNKQVCAVEITGIADLRLATAGRHIVSLNVGKMLKEMLDTDGSDYPFIGLISTISAGSTVSINASLSPTEPQSETHRQITESNVDIPTVASAGSGF
jgi:hypothetical protein